jgi:spore coat protein A
MAKITDVIKPFETKLDPENPKTLDLSKKEDGYQQSIYIMEGEAIIYDDGTNKITVPIWGYTDNKDSGGQYLGPSIVVNKNQTVYISWENALSTTDTLPFPAIRSDLNESDGVIPQNVLGVEKYADKDGNKDKYVDTTHGHNCEGRFSTHLHGGKVAPHSDGWPETMLRPEQKHLSTYENKQRATLLWYHDHAMHTTRLHAYAGMAGAWIITDDEEQALGLPERVLPLVIQDRNLTFSEENTVDPLKQKKPKKLLVDTPAGEKSPVFKLKARFLHKVEGYDSFPKDVEGEQNPEHGPLEFAGPLTLVNGKIWPVTEVEGDWYRLRLLNGSNSRTYRLQFAELDKKGKYQPITVELYQIGTDGGLLQTPVPLDNELILSPAERADVLVNFKPFAKVEEKEKRKIVLLNTAEAPFANKNLPINAIKRLNEGNYTDYNDHDPDRVDVTAPDICPDRTPYPEVMMFKVGDKAVLPYNFPALKDRFTDLKESGHSSFDAEKPKDAEIAKAKVRTVAIVEKQTKAMDSAVLVLWELQNPDELVKDKKHPMLRTTQAVIVDGAEYVVVAERFQDPVSYMVKYGTTEKWRFINLTADTHPMHMHLVQFQGVSRRLITHINNQQVADNLDDDLILNQTTDSIESEEAVKVTTGSLTPADPDKPTGLAANEEGLKDTIRVNPGEMVEVAAKFEGYLGRYVYHCHLLEHEDHDMMRQFVVTRDDLVHEMDGDMGHGDMPVISVGNKEGNAGAAAVHLDDHEDHS